MNEAPLLKGSQTSPLTLDVRDDINGGRSPFQKIMTAAAGLRIDQPLRVIAPFEPVPLYGVLGRQGFKHTSRSIESGDWEIIFVRSEGAQVSSDPAPRKSSEVLEVDARGLEPPQPLVRILEAVVALPANATLRARTDRRPLHLYPQLEARGFTSETVEEKDGSYLTQIRRR